MNRMQGLAQRREELVERSRAQRSAALAAARPLVRKAVAVDRLVGNLRRYPVLAALAVGFVALVGPRKILNLGARAVTLYMLFKR